MSRTLNRTTRIAFTIGVVASIGLVAYALLTSTNHQIPEPVISTGGDTMSSPSYTLLSSVGQSAVDTMGSASYVLNTGLFYMRRGATLASTAGDSLIVIGGEHQVIANGGAAVFVIDVKDSAAGTLVANARVDFTVEYEGATVGSADTASSDATGRVSKSLTLASGDGFYLVIAAPAAAPNNKTFLAVYTNRRKIPSSTDTNKKWTMFSPFAKPAGGLNGISVNGTAGVGSLIIYTWKAGASPVTTFQQYLSVSGQPSPNNSTVGTFSDFEAGRAYFALSKGADAAVGLAAGSTSSDSPHQILVHPGWNMIGNPFQHFIDWSSDVRLDTDSLDTQMTKAVPMSSLDTNSYHTKIYWRREGAGGGYVFGPSTASINSTLTTFDTTAQMKPWAGFWMKIPDAAPGCTAGCTLAFYPNKRIPQTANVKQQAPAYQTDGGTKGQGDREKWIIPLKASGANGLVDDYNYVGVAPGAKEGLDGHDAYKAPAIGEYVQVGIRESFGTTNRPEQTRADAGSLMAASLVPQVTAAAVWDVVVSASASGPVALAWDAGAVPQEYGAYLIGAPTGPVDLRQSSSLSLSLSPGLPVSLSLVVGTPEYLGAYLAAPLSKENTFAYPNPGPDATGNVTFKYNLQAAGDVTLKIFDAGGKLVREQSTTGSAGPNILTWDATNKHGQKLGSGVYIYILQSGGNKIVDKLAIVR